MGWTNSLFSHISIAVRLLLGWDAATSTPVVQNFSENKIQACHDSRTSLPEPKLDKGETKTATGTDKKNKTGCKEVISGQSPFIQSREGHTPSASLSYLPGTMICLSRPFLTFMYHITLVFSKDFSADEYLCLHKHLESVWLASVLWSFVLVSCVDMQKDGKLHVL